MKKGVWGVWANEGRFGGVSDVLRQAAARSWVSGGPRLWADPVSSFPEPLCWTEGLLTACLGSRTSSHQALG